MSQILLASQRALPVETQRNGYSFVHPDLEPALRDVIQLEAHSHAA
jgi:NAD dependent epimerase/dehydratase family enzyme